MLIDVERRVVGALAGQPRDVEDWRAVHDDAFSALKLAALNITNLKSSKKVKSRRGWHASIADGVSYGGGQQVRVVQH